MRTLLTSGSSSAATMRTRWPGALAEDAVVAPPAAQLLAADAVVPPLPSVPEVCTDTVADRVVGPDAAAEARGSPPSDDRGTLARLPSLSLLPVAVLLPPDAACATIARSVQNDSRSASGSWNSGSSSSPPLSSASMIVTCTAPGSVTPALDSRASLSSGDPPSEAPLPPSALAGVPFAARTDPSTDGASAPLRVSALPAALATALPEVMDDDDV